MALQGRSKQLFQIRCNEESANLIPSPSSSRVSYPPSRCQAEVVATSARTKVDEAKNNAGITYSQCIAFPYNSGCFRRTMSREMNGVTPSYVCRVESSQREIEPIGCANLPSPLCVS